MAEAAQLVELFVGDVQWEEKQGGRKEGVEERQRRRPERRQDALFSCGVVAISCGRKTKRFPVERILFIVSPQNVCSVLYIAGEEQLSELLLFFGCFIVQRLSVVNVTVERYAKSNVDCWRIVYCLYRYL